MMQMKQDPESGPPNKECDAEVFSGRRGNLEMFSRDCITGSFETASTRSSLAQVPVSFSTSKKRRLQRLSRKKRVLCIVSSMIFVIGITVGVAVGWTKWNSSKSSDNSDGEDVTAEFNASVVLKPGSHLEQGDMFYSPNGLFSVILTIEGHLELRRKTGETIWRSSGEQPAARCYLQSDGNLILRTSNGTGTWRTDTYGNSGAHFEIDDGGQIAVMYQGTALWLNGIPRGTYNGPSSPDLSLPLRGMFYYPWFPETWTVNGNPVKYQATLGRYHTGHGDTQHAHIEAFRYAHVDLAICSWFGPGTHNDPARLTNLMAKSSALKWTVYHEQEMRGDPSVEEIIEDLDHLKKWYAWRGSWAHMDGRPVIFVWNEGDCDVVKRWMQASNGEWFVVLKLFGGYNKCEYQPDLWHQYGPGSAALQYKGNSFSVSPGFWKADLSSPKLIRLNESEWRTNIQNMVDSGEPLQLVTTFNEWGEGTAVESANEWSSSTGQGMYMDVLHQIY